MDKKTLRTIYREKRKSLPLLYRQETSRLICDKLRPYLIDRTVLSYAPINEEVDVSFLEKDFDICLPRISGKRQMNAYRSDGVNFQYDRLGIREPDIFFSEFIPKEKIDVVIVPIVAFDEERNRLGYGGGYYDTYLQDSKALKIGVAFAIQKTAHLDREPFDIPMDLIICEDRSY